MMTLKKSDLIKKELGIIDDIHKVDRHDTLVTLKENSILSLSYVILLVSSTVICTLGLLLDSPAIVIGGMIISPLMWPMLKISAGISLARKNYISQALFLFLISVLISLVSAFAITIISPIKVLNTEILSRTAPTLLDVFVALAAGTVAALAVVQKKVSSSLAGVAIAASLMPPLCVGGIGLALLSFQTALGGLLLFIANVVSIIFVSIFVFRIVGVEIHGRSDLQSRGIIFVALMLLITSLPLFILLKNYSFEASSYLKTQQVLKTTLADISPLIYLNNVKTKLDKSADTGQEIVNIEADILVPEDIIINFDQKESIIQKLEKELSHNVILTLRVQKTIALQTETDRKKKKIKDEISMLIQTKIQLIDKSVTIDAITITWDKKESAWKVDAVLRSDPSIIITEVDRKNIQDSLSKSIKQNIMLNFEVISRLKLRAEPDIEIDDIKNTIREFLKETYEDDVTISSLQVQTNKDNTAFQVKMTVTVSKTVKITKATVEKLKALLSVDHDEEFVFTIDQLDKTVQVY